MTTYTITEAQRQRLIYATEIGLDCARDHAADVHEKYAGYKPLLHAAVDADVAAIEEAYVMLQSLEPTDGEPVAWVNIASKSGLFRFLEPTEDVVKDWTPLYTHPAPMRILTDEDDWK